MIVLYVLVLMVLYFTVNTTSLHKFSGNTLKIIAVISMLIDHLWYMFGEGDWYWAFRSIGRLAFPIYSFMISEGYYHSHDRVIYLKRLLCFGLISEIFADLAFYDSAFYINYQNIFFTLAAGLFCLMILYGKLNVILKLLIVVGIVCLSDVLHFDYGSRGVILILLLGVLRKYRFLQCGAGFLWMSAHYTRYSFVLFFALAFILLSMYSGERGKYKLGYSMYIVYPLHLLIFYLFGRMFL